MKIVHISNHSSNGKCGVSDRSCISGEEGNPLLSLLSMEEIDLNQDQKRLTDFLSLPAEEKRQLIEMKEEGLKKYKIIPIRLKGTNKTEKVNHFGKEHGRMQVLKGNCLDPVRGCPSYADPQYPKCPWDCYSEEAVRRYKIDYGKAVSMELNAKLLRKDLLQCQSDWIRIGVDGAPSMNWELTIRCAEIIASFGKTPVIVTRMWKPLAMEQLHRLIDINAIIHITVSAADEIDHLQRNLEIAKDVQSLGGLIVLRVVTFAYRTGDNLWEIQDSIMNSEIPVLEQPARILRKTKNTRRRNSMWEEIDQSRYYYHKSYITGKVNKKGKRWLTAGQLYITRACVKSCPECENQCLVKRLIGYGHVLGEENVGEGVGMIS